MTLGTMGLADKAALVGMCEAFKDKEAIVRSSAIEAVAKLGASTIPTLIEVLKWKDKTAKISACETLTRFGNPAKAALPALNELTKDPDDDVRKAALEAIEKINAPK
jgi:HEAT repeat protein